MAAQKDSHKYNLAFLKALPLVAGFVIISVLLAGVLWPNGANMQSSEVRVGFKNDNPWYSTLGMCLLVGVAALATFRWMHLRVRRIIASELGLLIMSKPIRAVAWSEVSSVRKALGGFLGGFYLVRLSDGAETYVPIEHEPPSFATLGDYGNRPTVLEQLCRKHGVWIEQLYRNGGVWTR